MEIRSLWTAVTLGAISMAPAGLAADDAADDAFVRVSERDPRYFELTNGDCYIPIGLNMIAPPDDMDGMERWMEQLAANGGNFIRV